MIELIDETTGKVVTRFAPGETVELTPDYKPTPPIDVVEMFDNVIHDPQVKCWRRFIDGVLVGAVCMSLVWMWLLA